MLIYNGTVNEFNRDVLSNNIGQIITDHFNIAGLSHGNQSEFNSWVNSMQFMHRVVDKSQIDLETKIAIEYQIPMTSKRVDFLISGKDDHDNGHVIVIELKQWEEAERTSREGLVSTFVGGSKRTTIHPSYQAYSYAKTIENFNADVQDENISLHPCAYLHNYKESKRDQLDNYLYQDIIQLSPIYLEQDVELLSQFIRRFVKKSDNGELLFKIDNGRIRPSKSLQDSLVSMMKGNQEFIMIDEQKVVYSTIKKLMEIATNENKKYTIIVEGGPGTGKTVIAINLLSNFISQGLNACYVSKNAAPRNVYFEKLKRGDLKLNYIKNLFKGSGQFVDCSSNLFDCLIVDEAHRLNEKSGMFQNIGENQIKEIIQASKVSIFFIDEDQIVTAKDIGSINEIKRWAQECGSILIFDEDMRLVSQFRCNGSEGYIAFLDHILGIKETANFDGFEMDYDIRIFDSALEMREALRFKNERNKARMLAGYCYEWVTKSSPMDVTNDIVLDSGKFQAKWNFGNTNTWAIDEESFEQVGCIHTSQGLEFDYVGVIIGQDMIYSNGQVCTNYLKRAKTDQSLKGLKGTKNFKLADRIIRNTYRTLMTRGQKGCYIYCEDKSLSNYLKDIVTRFASKNKFDDIPF